MEPHFTTESLLTIAGLVAFIELALNLFVKPALRDVKDSPYYGLGINVSAFLVGMAGSILAQVALSRPMTGSAVAETILRALGAAWIGTGGRETLKNVLEAYIARNGGRG